MAEAENEKPEGKLQEAARASTAPRVTRQHRTRLFQISLLFTTIAFAALTFLIKTTPSLPIDIEISRFIQAIDIPGFSLLMQAVSWPGFAPQAIVITLLIGLILYGLGLRWEAWTSLLAAIFSTLVNLLVKGLIQRPRPTIDLVEVFEILNSFSFPSGHVMFYLGLFGFVWFLAYSLLKESLIRSALLLLFGALILLVGASRVYLGQHWPSDVLGAYLLGSLVLVAIIYFYRWGKKRFFTNQPVAPE